MEYSESSAVCRQTTLSGPVEFRGKSLFHGYDTRVRLLPAEADTGVVFCRTDLTGRPEVRANVWSVCKEPRRTVIMDGEARVETIEHLMAALAGMHVDNCRVEIDSPEVPACDGSCRTFCDAIGEAGVEELGAQVQCFVARSRHSVREDSGRQQQELRPYLHRCLAVTYHLDYGSRAMIPPQQLSTELTPDVFVRDIAAARTFVLESEIKGLQKMGFGRHLSAQDLVVMTPEGPIDNQLRWEDEFVRHKILDLVGDLALCGMRVQGHISALRTGHHVNQLMAGEVRSAADRQNPPILEQGRNSGLREAA